MTHSLAPTFRPSPGTARRRSRGAILVGVLWVLVFLGFLAVVLRLHVGAVVLSVRVTEDKAAARIIAEAGLAQAAALVRAGPPEGIGPLPDEIQAEAETLSGRVSVTLTNEARRVDLNTAEKPLIVAVLRVAGAPEATAETVADRIIERRGKPAAGENPPPQPEPAPSADPIQLIAELALVPGVSPEVAIAAERYATVSSGLVGIRLDAADGRLLRAIPGLPPSVASAIARYRAGRLDRRDLDVALGAVTYHTTEQAITWRAQLQVDLPSGHGENHEALITISPEDSAPYRIIDWRRIANELE